MPTDVVPEPGVLARAEFDRQTPDPTDCLPPCEEPIASVSLSPGWVAITERELLTFHPNRDPALKRTARSNVTGLAVRRTGGRSFLGYAPAATLYGFGAIAVGALMLAVSPSDIISVPDAPGSGQIETIVQTLGWAMGLLGSVLLFTGILAALVVVAAVVYWLTSREVALVIEQGNSEPIECVTTKGTGTRALRELETALSADRIPKGSRT